MIRRAGERGQTLPIVALSAVALLGFAGLSADVGYLRYQQRIQQTAADSAAIAGATEVVASTGSSSTGSISSAAKNDAAANGFADTSSTTGCSGASPAVDCVQITVNTPPTSGNYAGNSKAVEVLVTKLHPRFFMKIFGSAPVPVTTRAVAIVDRNDNSCFYTLNQNNPSNFSNVTMNAPGCSLDFDSNVVNFQGSSLNVASVNCAGSCNNLTSPPVSKVLPVPDPCPQIPGCAYLANMTSSMPTGGSDLTQSGGVVNPGTYHNLNLSGAVTFNPGTYVINGTLRAQNATLQGTGVTFFFSGTGSMDIHQTTSIDLSACTTCSLPPTGTLPAYGTGVQNVLFYQAPPGPNNVLFNQNGSVSITGLVYFPNQDVTMNQTGGGYTVVVMGRGNFSHSSQSGFPGAGQSMILRATLAE
jgi:Putative Flp pilus-assembly TadE/G-like